MTKRHKVKTEEHETRQELKLNSAVAKEEKAYSAPLATLVVLIIQTRTLDISRIW